MSISTSRRQTGRLALCEATLHVHASHVRVPTYDRSALTPGIVRLGVGVFHRAHQAVYLDDLADRGGCSLGRDDQRGLRTRSRVPGAAATSTCGSSQGTTTTTSARGVAVSIPGCATRGSAIARSTGTIAPSVSLCSRLPSPLAQDAVREARFPSAPERDARGAPTA
jgi:hypothetical protein